MTLKFTTQQTITRYHDFEIEVDTHMMGLFEEDGNVETLDDFLEFVLMNYTYQKSNDSEHSDEDFAEDRIGNGKGNAQVVLNFLKERHKDIHLT